MKVLTPNQTTGARVRENGSKSGWRRVRLGDVVQCVNDREANPQASPTERVVGLEHLDPGSLHIKRWASVEDGTTFTRRFRSGQVLFGKRRAYQRKLAVADFDGICSGDILVFQPKDEGLIPELLPFIMRAESFWQHALDTSAGSLSPRTKWQDLARYEFALPPKKEQRRIAEMLRAADKEKEALVAVLDRLAALNRAVFTNLVKSKTGAAGCTIGDVIHDIVAGKSPACGSEPARETMFGVLKVSAVGNDGYHEDENKELLNAQDFQPEFEVQAGDFLVTRANALKSGVGRACIVEKTRRGLMLSDKTLKLLPRSSCTTPRVLLECMRLPDCRRYIEAAANGTDAKNISQEKLRLAPIPKLQMRDLTQLDDLLVRFDRSRAVAQEKLARSRALSRSLTLKLLPEP